MNTPNIATALLSLCINVPTVIDRVQEVAQTSWFQDEGNRVIFDAISQLNDHGHPVSAVTVFDQLQRNGTAAKANMEVMSVGEFDGQNVEYYLSCLREQWQARTMASAANTLYEEATNPTVSVTEARTHIEDSLSQLDEDDGRNDPTRLRDMVQAVAQMPDLGKGVSSGFSEIDAVTHGWQKQNLILLAARTAMGKSALALQFGLYADCPVAFFALEMSKVELTRRAQRMARVARQPELLERPLFIDETAALTIAVLRRKVKRLKQEQQIGLVIVDYLQLMTAVGGNRTTNREQEVASISRGLKCLAKEMNIPIIALSQLNRGIEQRKEEMRIPQLSDLRESGSLEQDADMVLFIHRPQNWDEKSSTIPAEIHIAKNRHGQQAVIRVEFWKSGAMFSERCSEREDTV